MDEVVGEEDIRETVSNAMGIKPETFEVRALCTAYT